MIWGWEEPEVVRVGALRAQPERDPHHRTWVWKPYRH